MLSTIKKLIPQPIKEWLHPIKILILRSSIIRYLIYLIFKVEIRLENFCWLDEFEERYQLKNSEPSIQYSPNYGDGIEAVENTSPAVYLYKLQNGYMSIESSAFYTRNGAFIERFQGINQQEARYNSGLLIWHNTKKALFKLKSEEHIKQNVLFLGGNGSFNYFHWLIEILPKLLLLDENTIKQYNIEALAVSDAVSKIANFKQSLDIFIHELNLPVIYLKKDQVYSFDNVYCITSFNNVLYNSVDNIPKVKYSYFSQTLISLFVRSVRDTKCYVQDSSIKFPKKIFLLRGAVSSFNKRTYNEEEVFKFFKAKGFAGIKSEEFSFLEQAQLFANASHIVGPSGAFWANLIFCAEGVQCISWLTNQNKDFSVYSTLAKVVNADMRFLKADTNTAEMHGSYKVDIGLIAKLYEGIQIDAS